MNIFSKLLSLGFLTFLAITPAFARDCGKRHDREEKCSLVGSYLGSLGNQSINAQFNEDGTVTVFVFTPDGSIPVRPYVGTWKCLGHNCFKFCATSPISLSESFSINAEKLCFKLNDCNTIQGAATFGTLPFNFILSRVACN